MKIHIVIHESFEAPAAIDLWIKENRHKATYTKLHEGNKFPENCDFDFLIIMGGPQSPETTTLECPHFDASAEIAFIQKAIKQNKIVLGVCLGAQFIGQALGARFEHSPHREIGVFEVSLTEDGREDPLFDAFPDTFAVGHWHGDMPGLTAEAKVLAESAGCPRQIVRYAPYVYGFQCHFEFTPEAIEQMISNSSEELVTYKQMPFIQSEDALRGYDYNKINSLLYKFLDNLCSRYKIQ